MTHVEAAPEEPPGSPFTIREVKKGEAVVTPYGSVLVGVNSVVVELEGGRRIPMPVPVAEVLLGYKPRG